MPQLAKERDGLQPPEGLLHQLALPMTQSVASVSRRARVDRAAAVPEFVLGDVRRDPHLSDRGDPGAGVIRFVGGDSEAPRRQRQLAEHDQRRIAFGGAAGRRDRGIDDQPVAVLRQQMREIPEFGLAADGFLVQPRVGIGGRLVRVVPSRRPLEIHGRILGIIGRPARTTPLRFEALVTRPRLEERPIDREMLVGEQPVGLDGGQHFGEERVGDVAIEQPVAIFRKRRRVPHRIVETQPDEPPIENVVIELLHQEPLAADAVQHLQQQGAQQLLWRNRGPTRRRVQPIEARRQSLQRRIRHSANRPQRMVRSHAGFRGDVTEHPVVSWIIASHRYAPFRMVGRIVVRRDQLVDPF